MSMGELPVDDLENPLTEVELALKHIDMANELDQLVLVLMKKVMY